MAENSGADTILYDCAGRVATITFNRPNKLNAFDDNQVRRLSEVLRRFDTDPAADVAIMCGRGRAFSSGQMFSNGNCVRAKSWSVWADRRRMMPTRPTS